jgi:hypothetical protein
VRLNNSPPSVNQCLENVVTGAQAVLNATLTKLYTFFCAEYLTLFCNSSRKRQELVLVSTVCARVPPSMERIVCEPVSTFLRFRVP